MWEGQAYGTYDIFPFGIKLETLHKMFEVAALQQMFYENVCINMKNPKAYDVQFLLLGLKVLLLNDLTDPNR